MFAGSLSAFARQRYNMCVKYSEIAILSIDVPKRTWIDGTRWKDCLNPLGRIQ